MENRPLRNLVATLGIARLMEITGGGHSSVYRWFRGTGTPHWRNVVALRKAGLDVNLLIDKGQIQIGPTQPGSFDCERDPLEYRRSAS